jgi:MFS family permease
MFSRRDYIWNFTVDSLDYAFFTLAMSFGSITTLLPLLAKRLGASNVEIGLIPAIAYLGWSLPALWGARASECLERKLPFILRATLLERLPYLGMAITCFFFAYSNPLLALYLIFIFLGISTFAMGFLGPIWVEMIGKVIHRSRWGLYFAFGNGIGALMSIWGSKIAEKLLIIHPFARNFGYCFLLASLAMVISYVLLALTREEKAATQPSSSGYLRSLFSMLREDRNFLHFLLARVLMALGVMGGAFYTVYLLSHFHIPDALVARCNAVLLVSQALSNFFWGPLGDKKGHKIVLLLGAVALVGSNLFAIFARSIWPFFLAFSFMGLNTSALSVGGMAILLDFAPPGKRSLYLGWGNFFAGFPSFLSPILGGKIADFFGYTTVFWVALLVNVLGFLWLFLGVREPRVLEGE